MHLIDQSVPASRLPISVHASSAASGKMIARVLRTRVCAARCDSRALPSLYAIAVLYRTPSPRCSAWRSSAATSPAGRIRVFPPEGARKGRVALMSGCVGPVLRAIDPGGGGLASTRYGIEVVLVAAEGRCGRSSIISAASRRRTTPPAAISRPDRRVFGNSRRHPDHRVRLRDDGEGLRFPPPQRPGLCGRPPACRRWRWTSVNIAVST